MPYHFGMFSTGTPENWKGMKPAERYQKTLAIVRDADSELVGMWWDRDEELGYVLLAGPNDPAKGRQLLDRLGCDRGKKTFLTPAEKG